MAVTIAAVSHLLRRNNGHGNASRKPVLYEDPESVGDGERCMTGTTKDRTDACLTRDGVIDAMGGPDHVTFHDGATSDQRSEEHCGKENEPRQERFVAERAYSTRVESLEYRCDLIERALQQIRIDMDKLARCSPFYDGPGRNPKDCSTAVPDLRPVRRSPRIAAKKLQESLQRRRPPHTSSMEALIPRTALGKAGCGNKRHDPQFRRS